MTWKVVQAFSAKMGNGTKVFHPGDEIDLPADKSARLLLAGVITANDLDGMEAEYLILLKRFWEIDTDFSVPMDESRRLDERLSELYRALNQAGRKVPVRLPVEHTPHDARQGAAI